MSMRSPATIAAMMIMATLVGCEGVDNDPVRRETVIGPAGGVAESFDRNARLEVPEGAVDGPTRIAITPVDDLTDDEAVFPGTAYLFEPAGLDFGAPVTVTIEYDVNALPDDVAETDLQMVRLVGDDWEAVPGSVVDAVNRSVSAHLTSPGTFAIRACDV